ncbi:MAG: AsmA family protein [Rhizobium sp.]|nr:AsmA family protein [Rhizobium sp.]
MTPRAKTAVALPLVALAILLVVAANVRNWNALREPIAHAVHTKTGRTLRIGGDLDIGLRWPYVQVRAVDVRFSNPSWARRPNMIEVRHATVDIAISPLFRGRIVFQHVELDHAAVAFEKSRDGRRNWLLDRRQRDSQARVTIRHLAVSDGRIEYDEPAQDTRLNARIATAKRGPDGASAPLTFTVQGRYKGEPLVAQGAGDPVLALRDETRPYHLNVSGKIGQTAVGADGHITDLLKLSAADLQIVLSGASLAQLYPLVGVVFPDTPPYRTRGRLVHGPHQWRYEKFSGEMGRSDIAGSLSVDTGGRRPILVAHLDSTHLDISDLGPLVGAGHAGEGSATAKPGPTGILPRTAFRTERWSHMDADVTLRAGSIDRPEALPLHRLSTHLQLRDGRLRLDPLQFDVAGGTLVGAVTLDGRVSPIRAAAKLKVRKLQLAQLFPTLDRSRASMGEFNGNIDLKGQGDTVAAMLGSADGRVSLLIDGGEVSKMMMETVSLHLLEILQLKLAGDEPVRIRCGIADFGVKQGVMQPDILVLDTDVSRIDGSGRIDLGQERLDLTMVPKSRKLSLVALRTPIHVQGSFAHPQASLDKGRLAMRGLGALALGAVNPVLALLPLIEAGRSVESECRRLIGEARTPGR